MDGVIEDYAPTIANEVLLSTSRYRFFLKRISRISKKSIWALSEHIKRGTFEPAAAEIEFNAITGITINLNDRQRLILTGRIDRVDILDDGGNKYVKIIDYKSGSTSFDMSDIFFGMQLQLILYLDAIIQNGRELFGDTQISGELLPGGVFYFNINDPMLSHNGELTDERLEQLVLRSFKMSGLMLDDESVKSAIGADDGVVGKKAETTDGFVKLREYVIGKIKEIGTSITGGFIDPFPYRKGARTGCDYCGYDAVCGFSARERKRYNTVTEKIVTERTESVNEI